MEAANWGDLRLPVRFWENCVPEPNSGCWIWIGGCHLQHRRAREPGSIPTFTTGRTTYSARRFAYAAMVERPNGRTQVHSICKMNECVNPMHATHVRDPIEAAQNKARHLKRSRLASPEKHRRYQKQSLYAKYGMSISDFELMLAGQGGCCAICARKFDGSKHSTRACVDHCHRTGAVRGLLCIRCNSGLGYFSDDAVLLNSALGYLAHHTK